MAWVLCSVFVFVLLWAPGYHTLVRDLPMGAPMPCCGGRPGIALATRQQRQRAR